MEYISYERQGRRITSYLLVITFLLFHFISAYGQRTESGDFITLTKDNFYDQIRLRGSEGDIEIRAVFATKVCNPCAMRRLTR
jgi:hypothetical protein